MNNIYQRPLFRQAGGPTTAPSPMPAAQAVSGDMAAQLQATEQMASQEMEAAGAQYVDNMISGLDNAEDTEEVINAIRGNEKPIQDRYQELAGIVGLQDAQATPESVLALVQPTMMMTEQGAMDTGIGELVQNLTGDIAMETDTGEPTPMGQGIGELMMGGAEPVQQYADGGIVQKFYLGGAPQLINSPFAQAVQGLNPMTDYSPAQLKTEYEARLPLYEQLLGDTANRQKQAQSKLSFDIAKAGLALASGVDPTTGQTMTGQPLGAQIARAAMPVAQSAQEAGQIVAEAGRGAKVAALQAAEQAQQQRLEQVGAERQALANIGGQSLLSGQEFQQRSFLQDDAQQFQETQLGLDRDLTRETTVSNQEHEVNLSNMQREANESLATLRGQIDQDLANLNNEARTKLQELIGDQSIEQLIQDGEIKKVLTEMEAENRLQIQTLIGEDAFKRLIESGNQAERLFELDTARRINEIELDQENTLARMAEQQGYDLERYRHVKNHEYVLHTENLKARYEEMDRRLGGGGFMFWTDPTVAELAADNQKFGQAYQLRKEFLEDQYRALDARIQQDALQLRAEGQSFDQALALAMLGQRERIAALQSMANAQFSFGETQKGILLDLISNTDTMARYGNGTLDPQTTSFVDTALSVMANPVTSYNPATGETTREQPFLPRGVVESLRMRQSNGLPTPFAKGGEAKKMQTGGPTSDYDRVFEAFGIGPQQQAVREEDVELPARIIEPGVDLTKGTGLLRGPREAVRGVSSYAKELGNVVGLGDFEPVFGETAEAATQLTTLGNVTQRFIRESVGGRALKDEIQALAEELAKPEGIQTRERTYEKLVNMRNQLMEIQDFAMSMVDTPEKFRQADLVQARKDLRLLQPLLENYDLAITSFEQNLSSDKPDPSLFEGR